MGNVLANISKDNTHFTVFENDQVLTADQLNDLFNYLDVQTRLTRTKGIGVGIICGLEIGMLENSHIAVSKGAAITTDGDMLNFAADQEFDLYEVFEDLNATYPYFRINNEQINTIYELKSSGIGRVRSAASAELTSFEQTTNTAIKDYVGVLYLEDYKNDPDICTGTDCDNKGAESVRELKVLLIHKNNMRLLLASMPATNKNYFALDDITVPRVSIKTTIDTYQELNDAFNNSLTVKEDIKQKLTNAYNVCRLMLVDEFDGADPTASWNSLLDEHFKTSTTIHAQYVYDFARDLSYAYNEMRETLFADNMICCPDVELFPKHVLMGLVKTASINRSVESPPSGGPVFLNFNPFLINSINPGVRLLSTIRFNTGLIKRRYSSIHIDTEYRHHFYESPVLNSNEDNMSQTRFCFMRINAMIKNFKVPTAEELQEVNQNLKITPGYFEDRPLGERSIPFYYSFNGDMPLNLYWNFKANVRKKENQIYSYSSNHYSTNPAVVSPLGFNILPYNFFRVEGHIGFNHKNAEAAINNLILQHNLPFNVLTVQVERNPVTIPKKPWYFSELHIYENLVRNTFTDHLNQVEMLHASLAPKIEDQPEAPAIKLSMDKFKSAKDKVLLNKHATETDFNTETFQADVKDVIDAATDIKSFTKKFAFSNTAVPHDFLINTDIKHKADLINDLLKQKETKKIEDLMLGNFMHKNPGLEHCGGVLRGGTFVLVYTSNDEKVVADFMLPYYVADKEIVANPPVVKPIPLPGPKFDFDKVFEKIPKYVDVVEEKVNTKYVTVDTKLNDFEQKYNAIDARVVNFDTKLDAKLTVLSKDVSTFDERLKSNVTLFDKVLNTKYTNEAVSPGVDSVVVGGKNFTDQVNNLRQMQQEVDALPPNTPERLAKETELLTKTDALTQELNKPEITSDKNNALVVNSILSSVHVSAALIQDPTLKQQASGITNNATNITKTFNLQR